MSRMLQQWLFGSAYCNFVEMNSRWTAMVEMQILKVLCEAVIIVYIFRLIFQLFTIAEIIVYIS